MRQDECIVVHCYTCERRLVVVPTVARAERVLWDHIDGNDGHDVTWWTSRKEAVQPA